MDLFKIIVVDNCCQPRLDSSSIPTDPRIEVIHCATAGSYAARNAGIRHSDTPLVAFVDSDCSPLPTWISCGTSIIQSRGLDVVGGNILPEFRMSGNPNLYEYYDSLLYLRQEYYVNILEFAATANMFARRRVFDECGMFNAMLFSGGDREWGERITRHGYSIAYSSDAVVCHRSRFTLGELVAKERRLAGGAFMKAVNSNKSFISLLWRQPILLRQRLSDLRDTRRRLRTKWHTLVSVVAVYLVAIRIIEILRLAIKVKCHRAQVHDVAHR